MELFERLDHVMSDPGLLKMHTYHASSEELEKRTPKN